jgi:hypothetical protein
VPETRRNSSVLNSEEWGENQNLSTAGKMARASRLFLMTWNGGEGGIRTRQGSLESVSYRFYIADDAAGASDAVAPCPLLPAGRRARILPVTAMSALESLLECVPCGRGARANVDCSRRGRRRNDPACYGDAVISSKRELALSHHGRG